MKESSSTRNCVRFGAFEADPACRELRKNGTKIRLQDQPFQVLALLLEHHGQVVTREELRQKLWPADTFVDFDNGLNTAINKIREALGDSAEKPRFVETLPRRGYRFLEAVTATGPEASIAVLPFLNLSADPENEFFADGMSEEIISALMQIRGLHVAARTSSFSFKGKHVDLRVIGEQLKVRTVLEGSVRRVGNSIRVTAQLVSVSDGYHLWSERYDRELKDIFGIQEEIAQSIVRRLEISLEDGMHTLWIGGTENPEAFRHYLRGRSFFSKRGPQLARALDCYKKAVDEDPNYALAWSAMADARNTLGFYGLTKPEECLPQAKDAAQHAVELNGSLAEAHNSLALSHLFFDWDRSKAEREFLYALKLNPRYALALHWYSLFYLEWATGQFQEGITQAEHAVKSDPLSGWARAILAAAYLNAGQLDKAIATAEETLLIEPESFNARWVLLTAYNAQGKFTEAMEFGETALRISGRAPWIMASLARSCRALGRSADSEALYMELQWRARREYVSPGVLGWAASAAGRQDEAIRYAEEAHLKGDPILIAAKYWPDFALLREDPRFDGILRARGWE